MHVLEHAFHVCHCNGHGGEVACCHWGMCGSQDHDNHSVSDDMLNAGEDIGELDRGLVVAGWIRYLVGHQDGFLEGEILGVCEAPQGRTGGQSRIRSGRVEGRR